MPSNIYSGNRDELFCDGYLTNAQIQALFSKTDNITNKIRRHKNENYSTKRMARAV
jgi:hypothetical protein